MGDLGSFHTKHSVYDEIVKMRKNTYSCTPTQKQAHSVVSCMKVFTEDNENK